METQLDRAEVFLREALLLLLAADRPLHRKEIINAVRSQVVTTPAERERRPNDREVWEDYFERRSSWLVKAGFLTKPQRGFWAITPRGERGLNLPPRKLVRLAYDVEMERISVDQVEHSLTPASRSATDDRTASGAEFLFFEEEASGIEGAVIERLIRARKSGYAMRRSNKGSAAAAS